MHRKSAPLWATLIILVVPLSGPWTPIWAQDDETVEMISPAAEEPVSADAEEPTSTQEAPMTSTEIAAPAAGPSRDAGAMPPFPIPATIPPIHPAPASTTTLRVSYHQVLPRDTDSAIDEALDPHSAGVAPCAPPRGFLFVFLPGTGAKPTPSHPLLDVATRNCLHAIDLGYPNPRAVLDDCARDLDPDCYEKWRLQKLDEAPRSPHLTSSAANSIENRLSSNCCNIWRRITQQKGGPATLKAATSVGRT